ncbi:MAG: hypothetical protein E7039_07475 [Lentisphaerae bacterium]|nr:hypothetical protein [Lentisphaerota bacterium]
MKFSAVLPDIPWRKHFHRNYLYLTGIVCSIVIWRMLPAAWLAAALLLLLTIFLLYKKMYRETLMLTAAVIAGSAAVFLASGSKTFPDNGRLENAVVRIDDRSAVGPAWFPDDLYLRWANAVYNGKKIQVHIPEKMGDVGLYDNKEYIVSGNLYALSLPPEYFMLDKAGKWKNISQAFRRSNYNDYLARNGVSGVLYLENIKPVPESKKSLIAQLRRQLAQRLDSNNNDAMNRAVIGAVTLGLRHRLSGGNKRFYANVGLAHLFSVSGLHVGVLAVLILFLMRPLPRLLHIPAAGTLICYVLTAGGEAPAVRAFVMIFVLVIFRSYFLRCRALEVLSIICGGFLIINPLYLTDGGFLYSFIITAVLIKSSEWIKHVVSSFSGTALLAGEPSQLKRRFYQWRGKVAGAAFFTGTASAASAALSLFFQNMFFAGGMLVNLLVLPVLMPLYLLAICKIILPGWSAGWNVLLNMLVDYVQYVAEIGNEFASHSNIMHISYLTVLIFTVLLMLFFTLANNRYSLPVLALLLLTGCFMFLRSSFAPERVYAVIWGGKVEKPVAAMILPQAHAMYLLNCNSDAVPLILDAAAYYGVSQIDRLDFGNPVAGCVNGLPYLVNNIPVKRYRKSSLAIRSGVFREYTEKLSLEPGAKVESLSVNDLYGEPEIKYTFASDGTLAVHNRGKIHKLERTRYPVMYILGWN